MAFPQHTRSNAWDEEVDPDRFMDIDALDFNDTSSLSPPSSQGTPSITPAILYDDSLMLPSDDYENDPTFKPDISGEAEESQRRRPPMTDAQKVCAVLEYMKSFSRLSLRKFLETLFTTDDPTLRSYTGIFLSDGGGEWLMKTMWDRGQHLQAEKYNPTMAEWIITTAAELCTREASRVTDTASRGPHYRDAQLLRVRAEDVTVSMVRSFKLEQLTALYDRTLPWLQKILSAVMEKGDSVRSTTRDVHDVSPQYSFIVGNYVLTFGLGSYLYNVDAAKYQKLYDELSCGNKRTYPLGSGGAETTCRSLESHRLLILIFLSSRSCWRTQH